MSYDNKRENTTQKYDHDHMIIRISNNVREPPNNVGHLHLYVPKEFSEIVKKAKKIARREGRSISKLVMDLLRDYVRRHEPGNPQLSITRFVDSPKPSSPVCRCGKPAAYRFHVDGATRILCPSCLEDAVLEARRSGKTCGWGII